MEQRTWVCLLALVVPSFVLVYASIPDSTWWSTGALSLASGASALALMAAAAVLGGRLRVVEALFGGLDRVYATHKWLGIAAFAFASAHLLFKAGAEGWELASILGLPSAWTRLVRQLSYVVLVLIVMLALNRSIPYRTWRWWHKLSGPFFLVVVVHWLSIRSPIALGSPAGVWLALVAAAGVAAAFYKLLLYPRFSSHAEYRVARVEPGPASVGLELAPVGRGIDFVPGQFGFLSLHAPGLREPHPFTIASASRPDERVRFVIRALGDYTTQLRADVRAGMHATVHAPFGRFHRRRGAREVWIGGGVGISPFLSWLDDARGGFENVTLFYFHAPERAFPSAEVLDALAHERGVEFVSVVDGPESPLFARRFGEIVADAGKDAVEVSFCGPKGLLAHVRATLRAHDVSDDHLRYEFFEFR